MDDATVTVVQLLQQMNKHEEEHEEENVKRIVVVVVVTVVVVRTECYYLDSYEVCTELGYKLSEAVVPFPLPCH